MLMSLKKQQQPEWVEHLLREQFLHTPKMAIF